MGSLIKAIRENIKSHRGLPSSGLLFQVLEFRDPVQASLGLGFRV